MATTNTLKFYRKAQAPSSPAAGAIWFSTTDKTIQIYTGSEWEKYAGNLKDATWSGNTLTITKYDGSSIALDFSDMASKSAIEAQLQTINTNITNAQNAANAAQADVDAVEKALGTGFSEGSTATAQLAAVKATADAAAAKTYVDSELGKKADKTQVTSDIAAAQSAAETNAASDAASKVATAKIELIGDSSDTADASTIYGAKAYADNVGTANLTDAKSYTDAEIQKLDVEDNAVTNQYVSAVSETDGKISVSRIALPVTGVDSSDKILELLNGKLSATVSMDYVSADKKIYLRGCDNEILSTIDATDFVADSFLNDVSLDANDNLQFTWNMADGSTKTDTVNISKYIDTYTAGTGLSLSGKEFSVDTSVIATKESVDDLSVVVDDNHVELVSLAGATVNGKAIGTTDADGEVSGNTVVLAGSDIAITGYTKGTAANLTDTDTVNSALGKLEARVDAAAAGGVQTVNSRAGNVVIATGTNNGTIVIKNGLADTGAEVAVAGLGSAAYTDSTAYATADQGALADSAVQTVTTDNTNQLDVTRAENDVKVNVKLVTKSEMMAGAYRNEDTANGDTAPLITAATVDYFVTTYVSDSINSALTWEEFE